EDVLQAEKFSREGNIQLTKGNWADKMQNVILPLTRDYQVEFDNSLIREIKGEQPEGKLMLQEKVDYLLFQPIFNYSGYETKISGKDTLTIPDGDKILVIHRN